MGELVRFGIMHVLPPVAGFAVLNAVIKRHLVRLVFCVLGSAAAFGGLAVDDLQLSMAGLVLLIPPVVTLCRDLHPRR
ncbi:hypothetical protein [Streptomyces sp. NPDC051572]|uniref:hypothetical protein n=1 Tax=Streptomyces sp. NPDC051572 TaxID=3155802 RepID=UPI00344D8B1E